MFYNKTLVIGNKSFDYICFGRGRKTLVILTGLGDGLKTVKGSAATLAVLYRKFAKDYTVYSFSRANELPNEYSTLQMADDLKLAFDYLKIDKADLLGVSMGGMIAQHFAILYPDCVNKLILVATSSKANSILSASVNEWISYAKSSDHKALMDSNLRLIYSEKYYKQNKWLIPVIAKLTKPKTYSRFLVLADACLKHNAYDKLHAISAKTLVIGGEKDLALGYEASIELANAIPEARLYSYPEYGHGLYDEAKDFQDVILGFLR